jgi:putative copper resistance protein D
MSRVNLPWRGLAGAILRLALAVAVGALVALAPATALGHGYASAPPSVVRMLVTWSLDPVPWIATLAAAIGYLLAVRRIDAAHPRTPVPGWRVAAWLAGLATILIALASSIDLYAGDLLTVHMIQHLLLAMVAPPLLLLGAPITTLLRVAGPQVRRRLILPVLHSRLVAVVSSPFVAWPTFALVMWFTHFSTLYDAALENPAVHVAEHAALLASGILFWSPAVAADPSPHRLGWGGRLAYLLLQMPVNAAVGLAIYFAPTVLYPHYATLVRFWGPDPLTDQQIGGVLMWGAGDLILLGAFFAVVVAWMQADARRSRRSDLRRVGAVADPARQPDETALVG